MVYSDIHLPLLGFIALDWSLMIFALGLVLLRLYLRRHRPVHTLAANLSDAFTVCSWFFGIGLISINTWKNRLRHENEHLPPAELYYGVPREKAAYLLYVSWISLYFIYISLWFSKAAFIAFYYDLFERQSKRLRIVLWLTSAFTLGTFILHMCLLTFWCHPISNNWNSEGHLCSAVHSIPSVTISTFANIGTDILILCIPLSLLSSIARARSGGFSTTYKFALCFILLLASLSITAALARFVVLVSVRHAPRAEITHTIDVCSLVEIFASLFAVCLPSLRLLVRNSRAIPRNDSAGEKSSRQSSKDRCDSADSGSGRKELSLVHIDASGGKSDIDETTLRPWERRVGVTILV